MASMNSNKESFELLRGSPDSNSASDLSDIVFPIKKKRFRRRLKNNPSTKHEEVTNHCNCTARTITLTLFCLVLLCWLMTLTWLAFVLHSELNRLTSHVSEGGKKMKKRKELDALVAKVNSKRCADGVKRSSSAGGVSSHDKLLSDSTDEQDYWTSSAGDKSLRCHRRGYLVRKRTCSTFLRTCSVILIFTCVVATTTVMWLFVDVREQVTSLRTELSQVVAGIQGVPDALQKCHTLSKDLQKNQSQIMSRLLGFSLLLTNFSSEITGVKSGLQTVQDQLKSSPDLVNNPRLVKDLSASVADFGSQIRDLNSTVSTLKDQYGKLDTFVGNLVTNITEMEIKLTELSSVERGKGALTEKNLAAEKEAILAIVSQVSRNLSVVNDTLSNKLQWTVQDQSKDHSLIENLREMNENVTARVKTLEGLCAKEPESKMFTGNLSNVKNFTKPEEQSKPSLPSFEPPSAKSSPFSGQPPRAGKDSEKPKTLENPP